MTDSLGKLLGRSSNFLRRMLKKPAWNFSLFVEDPRNDRGKRWKFNQLMQALFFGLLTNRSSLRAAEQLTEWAGKWLGKIFNRRVPDTTLYEFVGMLSPQGFRKQLHRQIHTLWRSKSIEPVGFPHGVVAIDNKALWNGKGEVGPDPDCQTHHYDNRPPTTHLRVVRTVLVSAASKPAIDQVVIRKDTNECGMFPEVFEELEKEYKCLYEILSMDSGFCSLANADLVARAKKAYVFALKGNQSDLYEEAQRILGTPRDPEIETEWEHYQGKRVRWRLYRSFQMAGYLDWKHLEQVWRVEKEIVDKQGKLETENHYYITNLHKGRLKPDQILLLVRSHWGIENNCYWTLDCIWDEDTKAWCTTGYAIQVLGLLRLMAYNLVGQLRFRYLRDRREKIPWKEWLRKLFQILIHDSAYKGSLTGI